MQTNIWIYALVHTYLFRSRLKLNKLYSRDTLLVGYNANKLNRGKTNKFINEKLASETKEMFDEVLVQRD